MALTHFDPSGAARMVDVAAKPATRRQAIAEGRIRMQPGTLTLITAGGHAKGDVLGIARIAAIMGAKRTAELVPLCHPLSLTRVDVALQPQPGPSFPRGISPSSAAAAHGDPDGAIVCRATVETVGPTGVEMEALCAVQVGLLTVYDMCKAVDRGMIIDGVQLLSKSGGRSGDWQRQASDGSSQQHSHPEDSGL